jgi:hypothetical protein
MGAMQWQLTTDNWWYTLDMRRLTNTEMALMASSALQMRDPKKIRSTLASVRKYFTAAERSQQQYCTCNRAAHTIIAQLHLSP